MSQLLTHFGFLRDPFGRTPTEAVLRHKGFEEAFRRLLFTLELEGIAVLVAEPGCGKSLLLGELADHLQKDTAWAVHYLAHTTTGPFGLVNVLARKTGTQPRRSRSETAWALTEKLLEDDRRHLLVVDESHDLPNASLEDLRLLTVADFDRKSPFLLLLAGQPSLDARLQEPVNRALDQRVTTFVRLVPLARDETQRYIQTRLDAAGAGQTLFEEGAVDALHDGAGGVPRRINILAKGALIVAASKKRRTGAAQDVLDAAIDRGRP